jgi:RNA polymerase sigma-54 factor
MDMFQIQSHALRPLTTAHLAQTMTLLSMTADELRQEIESELSTNPALEMVEERRCPTCSRLLPSRGICPTCSCPKSDNADEPVVFISPREDFTPRSDRREEEMPEVDQPAIGADLPTYVFQQIAPELAIEDRSIAAFLLTHLDDDGLLTVDIEEVVRFFHVPPSRVEQVLALIQRANPIGVGARSPREALVVQVEVLAESQFIPEFTVEIINSGMDKLSRHQLTELAHQLNASTRKIQEAVHFISENLNPYPARSYWGDVRQPSRTAVQVYRQPDIIISYLNQDVNNPLVVEIIMPLYGTLRVNPLFRRAVRDVEPEKQNAWRSDLERASLLVKCIQQRNHTMQRLLQKVVGIQREAIVHGERYLRQLTRAELAVELEVHESTISRAVSSKTVQLPTGRIVPLASFFDRSLNARTVLCQLISEEHKPMSDSELAKLLAKEGFNVARRTVAKYRAMEGILPAHLRNSVSQQV